MRHPTVIIVVVIALLTATVAAAQVTVPGSASAEPIETWAPVACEPNDNLICNVEYDDLPGISITMDVYMPPAGQTYPGVILIHGGGWESGDKRSAFMIARADYLTSRGLVAVAINYRLTCDPPVPESVADADLCV
nr:carboxylesterase family protein [Actinomycetota bacterium]